MRINYWHKWLLGLCAALSAGNVSAAQPMNMPVGVTDISANVFSLHMLAVWLVVAIGVVVFVAMFYSIIAHRKSRGVQPATFHESTTVEAIWTIIPFIILVALAVPATKTLIEMEDTGNYDLTVKITGYQWLWHYEYVEEGVDFYSVLSTPRSQINNEEQKSENYLLEVDKELVLPIGKKIRFLITSNDVIHAWWVPELAVKKDAVPGFINEAWTKINQAGIYRGQCAELCGRDHGFMPVVVRAVPQEEFDNWLAQNSTNEAGVEYAAVTQ